jgi:hypothetical protein
MPKTSNNNTNRNKTTKPGPELWDEYYSLRSFKKEPINSAWVDKILKALRDFGDDENSLNISDFYDQMGIPPTTYKRLMAKSEPWTEVHSYVIRRLGSRRERGALERKYDASTVKATIGWYCEVSRSEQERLSMLRLNSEGQVQGASFNLVMNAVESTGKVPKKKNK